MSYRFSRTSQHISPEELLHFLQRATTSPPTSQHISPEELLHFLQRATTSPRMSYCICSPQQPPHLPPSPWAITSPPMSYRIFSNEPPHYPDELLHFLQRATTSLLMSNCIFPNEPPHLPQWAPALSQRTTISPLLSYSIFNKQPHFPWWSTANSPTTNHHKNTSSPMSHNISHNELSHFPQQPPGSSCIFGDGSILLWALKCNIIVILAYTVVKVGRYSEIYVGV